MGGQMPTVMLVDDDHRQAARVTAALRARGVRTMRPAPGRAGLLRRIEQQAPDVIVIDVESPGRDLLESLSVISAVQPIAIVMCCRQEDPDFIARAVQAGVTSYLVERVAPDRMKPVIDAALAQFRRDQHLRLELASARQALDHRRLVDRAKALLTQRYGGSEQQSYDGIRREAMNRGLTMAEVAATIIHRLSSQERTPWTDR